MANSLTCFEVKKHASDFLNETLESSLKDLYHSHLSGCPSCKTLLSHYQIIQTTLAKQPKASLPQALKNGPFSAALPKLTSQPFSSYRWERSPWYLRLLVESSLIVFCVVGVVSSTPLLRDLYENHIEKSLKEIKEESPLSEDLSLSAQEQGPESPTSSDENRLESNEDEFNGEDDSHAPFSKGGASQLWRFTLKTVSPDELRVEIIKTLSHFGLSPKLPGVSGIRVPGGIEFNFLLASDQVNTLKEELHRLAPQSTNLTPSSHAAGSEAFTWYKVHSKKKLPDGKAQVIIWISQPH